jgi:putative DNA primase/helicase
MATATRSNDTIISTETLPALEELKAKKQWVVWCLEPAQEKDDRLTKVPYQARNGCKAASTHQEHWCSYDEAVKASRQKHNASGKPYNGIGFVFNDDFTGIDLDHCINPDGSIDAWAQEIIDRIQSYAEYSQSKTGIHLLVRGLLPEVADEKTGAFKRPGTKKGLAGKPHEKAAIEMYCEGRFFVMTGNHFEGTPPTIEERQEQLLALHSEIVPQKQEPRKEKAPPSSNSIPTDLSERELLERIQASKAGPKFSALWQGDTGAYGDDDSRADLALCTMLAWWTGGDTDRIDRLFRQSALYREKWDSKRGSTTYGALTIEKALSCIGGSSYHPDWGKQEFLHRLNELIRLTSQFQKKTKHRKRGQRFQLTPKEIEIAQVLDYLAENELGDAKFFADVFEDQVCYDHTAKEWYLWAGHYWRCDTTGQIHVLVAGVLGTLYLKAGAELNTEQAKIEQEMMGLAGTNPADERVRKLQDKNKAIAGHRAELAKRAKDLRSAKRTKNVMSFIQSLPQVGITSEQWDSDPWLLATPHGIIDLRTGMCRDGEPSDYIRTVCPTEWEGLDAACPRFEQFLREIFEDKPDREPLIAFLQRLLGYGITGETTEHIFPILYGEEGRNGKDTLLETLKFVLGTLVGAVSNDVFLAQDKMRSSGAATPHIADLQGKRLVWGSETKQGDKLNVAQIKLLTGGGDISARHLYGRQYTFTPSHKLLLMTNYKPHADAHDKAFWSRACLIEFGIRFLDHPVASHERKADHGLLKALKEEAAGILAWLVRGCLEWQERKGLDIPESVRVATGEYRDGEDRLLQFITDCCLIQPECTAKAKALYDSYLEWCKENNIRSSLDGTLFGKEMSKRYQKKKHHTGWHYYGIGILSAETPTGSDGCVTGVSSPVTDAQPASEAKGEAQQTTESDGCDGSDGKSASYPHKDLHRGGTLWKNPSHPSLTVNTQSDETALQADSPSVTTEKEPVTHPSRTGRASHPRLDEAHQFYRQFFSQEGYYLRLRPDNTIAIGVPEELSDAEFEAIRTQVDACADSLREVLREGAA